MTKQISNTAKKDLIHLIHQIVKDIVLDRIQNRELKDISFIN